MLEPINLNGGNREVEGTPDIVFRKVMPNSSGVGLCYVRGGRQKFSDSTGKPFVTLVLQDIEGNVIPGYLFNVEDFVQSGADLSKVTGGLVKLHYRENSFGNMGLTLLIDKLEKVSGAPSAMYAKYLGSVSQAQEYLVGLAGYFKENLGYSVSLPETITTASVVDVATGKSGGLTMGIGNGKVGGLAQHYNKMMNLLKVLSSEYDKAQKRLLAGMFLVYISVHNTAVTMDKTQCTTATLVYEFNRITANLAGKLKLGDGAFEIVNAVLYGNEPTDIFARTVVRASTLASQTESERNVYNTLGLYQSGNAGYGKITRYLADN